MGKSARAACKREVRSSRQQAIVMSEADKAKFDAKQAAMAKAMAAPKIPVRNSRAHQNMTIDGEGGDAMMMDATGNGVEMDDLEVDAETLARARDAERRNHEAAVWGLNPVGKADIFLKTKKGSGVSKKGSNDRERGRRGGGLPTAKQLAMQTFQSDGKSRKKMKRQLKQVKSAKLKVLA